MLIAKSAIETTFLVNLPAHVSERIQGIPGLLEINSDTLICRLDRPYIRGIETEKHSFSDTIGAPWCLLTGPLTVVSFKVVFRPTNDILFLHTIMIEKFTTFLINEDTRVISSHQNLMAFTTTIGVLSILGGRSKRRPKIAPP